MSNEEAKVTCIPLYGGKVEIFGVILPLFLIVFFSFFFFEFNVKLNDLFYFFFFKIIINQWHVFLSFYLTLEHQKIQQYIRQNLTLVFLSCFAISIVGIFSVHYFKVLFGYFGLYHIIMQLYGLLIISSKKSQDKIEEKMALAVFCVMIIASLLYWFQGFSRVPHSYMVSNNILKIPTLIPASVLITIVLYSAASYLLYALYKLIAKKILNQGQLIVMIGTFVIFSIGLVFAKSNNLFYLLSLTFHGLTYSAHLYFAKERSDKGAIVKRKMNVVYTLVGAILWTISLEYFADKEFLYPLLYAPLIMHFVFDGYFWKKNRYAQFT